MKKEDDWLEQQRTIIVDVVNSVSTLIMKEYLKGRYNNYFVDFDISTAVNCIRLSVVKRSSLEVVRELEYCNLRYILDSFFGVEEKEKMQKEVAVFLKKMEEMRRVILFYSEGNKIK